MSAARYRRACAAAPTSTGSARPGDDVLDGTADAGTDLSTAKDALFGWALQRAAGIAVYPPDAAVREGATVLLRFGVGPLAITAPCRVTAVLDEPDRAGFTYATLPGHPECGTESFVLTRSTDGRVRLRITGWSRPATWYARLGAPVTRLVQARILRTYLRALRANT